MAKTKYQDAAMKYVEDYLERLLKTEEVMDRKIDLVVRRYMKRKENSQL